MFVLSLLEYPFLLHVSVVLCISNLELNKVAPLLSYYAKLLYISQSLNINVDYINVKLLLIALLL